MYMRRLYQLLAPRLLWATDDDNARSDNNVTPGFPELFRIRSKYSDFYHLTCNIAARDVRAEYSIRKSVSAIGTIILLYNSRSMI